MKIMNSKPLAVLQAAVLGLLLAQTDRSFGQTQPVTNSTYRELRDRESIFLTYIVVAENECMNASSRRLQNNRLWETNVATAEIKLAVAFALMDGNDKLPGYEVLIGKLVIRFPASVFGRGEDYWKNYFRTNYTALRTRAYELQNKLDPLVSNLSPEMSRFLKQALSGIRGNQDPVKAGDDAAGQVPQGGGAGGGANPRALMENFDPNNQASVDAFVWGSTHTPSGALSAEDAQKAMEAAKSLDIPTLLALCQKYPGNPYLQELLKWALLKKGLIKPSESGDSFEKIVQNHPDIFQKYPGIGSFLNPSIGGTVGPVPSSPPGTVAAGSVPPPGIKFVTPGGGEFDIRPFLGQNGELLPKTVVAHYTDIKGGQIDSEAMVDADYKTVKTDTVTVQTTEEPGSRIEWRFTIKQIKSAPAGQGFNVTFQLVNDGPPDAVFAVTAWGWDGPDASKEEKASTETQTTVTFPKRGSYVIKASGTTKKYGSKFTISQPENF